MEPGQPPPPTPRPWQHHGRGHAVDAADNNAQGTPEGNRINAVLSARRSRLRSSPICGPRGRVPQRLEHSGVPGSSPASTPPAARSGPSRAGGMIAMTDRT